MCISVKSQPVQVSYYTVVVASVNAYKPGLLDTYAVSYCDKGHYNHTPLILMMIVQLKVPRLIMMMIILSNV